MAKKKETEEAPDTEPVVNEPTKPKEKLIAVTAFEWFSDGNLCEYMAQYGYPCAWPAGETRSLPMWLLKRCESSGAEFVEPDK